MRPKTGFDVAQALTIRDLSKRHNLAVWAAEGREVDRARRALRSQRLKVSGWEDPFAAIIRCTADPAKADKRTRSKWSRVMRYAEVYKPESEPLDRFIRRKGGINAYAALGRGAALTAKHNQSACWTA